jgi:alpha-L-rhamnosidase
MIFEVYQARMKRLCVFFALLFSQIAAASAIEIPRVICDLMENPSGISTPPRLGWQLRSSVPADYQTAYQILVSSNPALLQRDQGDVWDSQRIKSDKSQFVVFAGKPLEKGRRYFWKVKVWDASGKPSPWSAVAYWDMAPDLSIDPIQWIGAITRKESRLPEGRNFHSPELRKKENADLWNNVEPLAKRSILLRKSFHQQKKIVQATVYVSGLGHYELLLNGEKVGNSEFAPLWSDYDKTVYYNTFRVEKMLASGENVIGVWLGNGMYNVSGNRYRKLLVSFGPPTLFFRMDLQYEDGSEETITSDQTWKYTESPITFNCIYGGEDYDANLEQRGWDKAGYNDSSWKKVVVQESPKGKLTPQLAAPVEVMKQYDIKSVKEPKPGTYVLDMGQNLSGFPTIKVQGKKGQTVKLVPGESLTDEGLVSQKRSGGPYYFEYTLKGDEVEEWRPKFSYYGYQYIQIENVNFKSSSPDSDKPVLHDVKSNFIYNSSGETGSFSSSNEIFNQAHLLINNAVKSNWQSVFTDCPHREKLGWLEETHLNGPGLLYNYNLTQYIPKIMRDIADGQREDGLVPSIVPEYVIFGGDFTDSPEWGVAAVVLPWMYYEFYGDASLIEQYYPVMKKYVDYLTTKSSGYIVSHGLGDWYDYGDHAAGYSKNSPIPLSATAHYYFGTLLVKRTADFLNRKEDAAKYEELSGKIKEAYNQKYFNSETRQYATGSQYSNAISLYLGLADDQYKQAVLDNLIEDIHKRGNRLTTGDVGNRYLYKALADNDKNDVMYAMHNHYDTPGYGFQIKFGLTTLTEQWDPRKGNSWNHFMMGQIEEWFYESLAGIVPDEKVPGFKHFVIQPKPAGDLTSVNASHQTLYGDIKVSWRKTEKSFSLTIHVPVNTTADVILPVKMDSDIRVNNKPLKEAGKKNGVLSFTRDQSSLKVGSGVFVIDCKF